MVFVRDRGLHFDSEPEHLGRDERVAVAVAADPGAHRDRTRVGDRAAESTFGEFLDIVLERRDRLEDARPVVAQGLVDLVTDPELRQADLGGLPQRQDFEPHEVVELGEFARALTGSCSASEQLGHGVHVVEHGLAADFGGVGGDYR